VQEIKLGETELLETKQVKLCRVLEIKLVQP
jgi:hypothetical protein